METDSEGHRLGALGQIDYSKELIVLCGDSYMFGWGVSSDETFASYLDESIYKASNERVRVVNLGVGGYGLLQHGDTIKKLLARHKVNIAAVVLLHSPNDATDNINTLGYHLGTWETREKNKPRNHFHLVNLVAYVVETIKQRKSNDPDAAGDVEEKPAYLQDMLWSYERVGLGIRLPEKTVINEKEIVLRGLTKEDMDVRGTLDRQTLTPKQKEIMLESIIHFHRVLKWHDTKIFHAFIYTTPDWYIDEITAILKEVPQKLKRNVIVLGRTPPAGDYQGPVSNTHSGGHYTPKFNRYWAEKMLTIFEQYNIY